MPSTTKVRTLGGGLVDKIGFSWFRLWKSSGGAIWANMPGGEDAASMAAHAAANGVRILRLWLTGGDTVSYEPEFEPRPGEFWYGGALVTRDGNGDITNTLYTSSQSPPSNQNNIKEILDELWANNIGASIDLASHDRLRLTGTWNYNPYKLNTFNAASNVRAAGTPGWLVTPDDFWTDATSKAAYKNRLDAFLYNFGDHEAIKSISLGNEYMLLTMPSDDDFFDWVDEMATYLWNNLGTVKPAIHLSTYRDSTQNINNAFGYLSGRSRNVAWHNYWHGHKELSEIKAWIDTMRAQYSTFEFEQEYTGQQRKYSIWIEENWGFGEGPTAVPPSVTDINIQGDPVLKTLAYKDTPNPDDTVDPYPHERMYAFLAMAMDPTMVYMRWPNWIDGIQFIDPSLKRCAEIMYVADDFQRTAVFHPEDMERWEDNISSSGVLSFKAALKLEEICLTFVFVGSGVQDINFGITGSYILVTYAWDGDGADNWDRVVDEANVDAAATTINFGSYTDGFCPGYLIKSTDYRNPVQTTITTEVVVDVVLS